MDFQSFPRVILWSAPRCTSTVFEHSIGTLRGIKTFHEVYTNAAYFGDERTFDRYLDQAPIPHHRFSDVQLTLEGHFPDHSAVFCKEMAYSVNGHLDSLPRGYRHSFLIRSPRKAITSMYRLARSGEVPKWRDFDPREVGFDALWGLYEYVRDLTINPPVIIDSDDLLSRPGEAMHAYCNHVGLEFDPSMLQWGQSKNHERLERWGEAWYQTLLKSKGFSAPPPAPDNTSLPVTLETAIEKAQPHYDALFAKRLTF